MRTSRARFKYALRFTRNIEDTARADSLAKDLSVGTIDGFWDNVRKLNSGNTFQTNTIDGVSGENDISNYWKDHFYKCQFVNEVKYLGVMIHSSMKTTIDVTRQTKKFYMQANLLLRNFRHCSDDVKCSLFQTYCTNMYCCQLWFNSTKSSINKLSTSYNSVLRRLLCISKPYSASNRSFYRTCINTIC